MNSLINSSSDKELIISWGNKLKLLRKEARVSQSDLALKTGMSRSSIAEIEKGRNFSVGSLIGILRAIDQLDKIEFFTSADLKLNPLAIYKAQKKSKTLSTNTYVEINLLGELIGVLIWDEHSETSSFEFTPNKSKSFNPFINLTNTSNILRTSLELKDSIPAFLTDSLPGEYGIKILTNYCSSKGINFFQLSPIEQLKLITSRSTGAIEFSPDLILNKPDTNKLNLEEIYDTIISESNSQLIFDVASTCHGRSPSIHININQQTQEITNGNLLPTSEQESWVLKFNKNIGTELDRESGKIEYAYHLIAKNCGINMMDAVLNKIGGQQFFMVKRFDRLNGNKIHTQSFNTISNSNHQQQPLSSYEELFSLLNHSNFNYPTKEQLFKRMVFNVVGRNLHDNPASFVFMLSPDNSWELAPAMDLSFNYFENFKGKSPHLLSINGKLENHTLEDIISIGQNFSIKNPANIVQEINQSFNQWNDVADQLGIAKNTAGYINSKINLL